MEIDCLLSPADIAAVTPSQLTGATCVVFDILRATSSIVTAMAHGCTAVRPARTIEEARSLARTWPGAKLAGERQGDPIEGFDFGNSPLEFVPGAPEKLITTTTNGTVALRACAPADTVLVAALLNLSAVADWLTTAHPGRLLLVCAGTFETAALEDLYAAGSLIGLLGPAGLTDAARTAAAVAGDFGADSRRALESARNGRALRAKGRAAEVVFCAQRDRFEIVPCLADGVLSLGESNLPPSGRNATSEQ